MPLECPESRSEAFYEGCLTYVDDPERGADVDDDGDPIPRRLVTPRISLSVASVARFALQ